jgi:hypothetical protein
MAESKFIVAVKIYQRNGGDILQYADVDAETFRRWETWFFQRDYASMKHEAPRVLRMQLTADEADRRINSGTDPAEVLICSLGPTTYADEVLP